MVSYDYKKNIKVGKVIAGPNPYYKFCGHYLVLSRNLMEELMWVCNNCHAKFEKKLNIIG